MTADLAQLARKTRILLLRMIHAAGSGHPGGALSAVELMVHLHLRELRKNSGSGLEERDRFVLSKGHAVPALYAVQALGGQFPVRELAGFRRLGSPLQGHPHCGALPLLETCTGSLGQGFSAALGMALGLRHQRTGARVHVMLGDGELQEGMVWEAAMAAAHYRLDNLCAVLDYNRLQSDERVENVIALEPLRAKWESFNWHVFETDGHDFGRIADAYAEARAARGRPSLVLAHTLKGKGVGFMEDSPLWHGSVKLSEDDLQRALGDLFEAPAQVERYLAAQDWSVFA